MTERAETGQWYGRDVAERPKGAHLIRRGIPFAELIEMSRGGRGEDECWPWVGAKRPDGYGNYEKINNVSRHVYELMVGPISEGQVLRHTCDFRPCVNYVQHLIPGTHLQNMQDRSERNRQPRGSDIWQTKLTEEQVREIRRIYVRGSGERLAQQYGVNRGTITKIVRRELWSWLDG